MLLKLIAQIPVLGDFVIQPLARTVNFIVDSAQFLLIWA